MPVSLVQLCSQNANPHFLGPTSTWPRHATSMSTQPRTFVFLRPTLTVRSPSHRPPNLMPPACVPRTLLFDITTLPPQFARSARAISVADKTSLHPLSCLPHRHHHHLLVSSAHCFASSLFSLESGRWSRHPGVSHWDEEEEGMVMVGGRGEELGLQQMSAVHRDGGGRRPPLVPLATLIGRELRGGGGVGGGGDRPSVRYGQAALAKRGEDYFLTKPDCFRVHGDPSSSFSVFAIFDGHNGISAAVFTKEHLLDHVMSAMEPGIGREEWLQALPRALVAGFVKTDIEFQRKGEASGTTATLVVIDGWTVTVASVGDSRCILDSRGAVTLLTVDHRLEENVEERERVTASGGEVGRLNICGGQEVGPLRCWPGGLCLSRSIGDMDVGEFIVPIPHVKQVKLSNAGGRLIIASDGIWDSLSSEVAAMCCRGLPTELAAKLVVKEALRTTGLKDDTTCLVVDIIPSNHSSAPATPKNNQNKLRSIIFGKRSHSTNKLSDGAVEEIFEEGSAILAERLGAEHSARSNSGPVRCAICQVDQTPDNGLSINGGGSYILHSSKHWEGPLLCADCQKKKDAMEGKRSNRQMITS